LRLTIVRRIASLALWASRTLDPLRFVLRFAPRQHRPIEPSPLYHSFEYCTSSPYW